MDIFLALDKGVATGWISFLALEKGVGNGWIAIADSLPKYLLYVLHAMLPSP